jgi:hypothetical protein
MMSWVYPTKTSQNILLFKGVVIGLKPLQTDLVDIVSLINLTSFIDVILTVLDSSYHFSSMRQNSTLKLYQNILRHHKRLTSLDGCHYHLFNLYG